MVRIEFDKARGPYSEVINIIDRYYSKLDRYEDVLVTLRIGDVQRNIILYGPVGEEGYRWEYSWWKGEVDVILLGFLAISDIKLLNYVSLTRILEPVTVYWKDANALAAAQRMSEALEYFRKCDSQHNLLGGWAFQTVYDQARYVDALNLVSIYVEKAVDNAMPKGDSE